MSLTPCAMPSAPCSLRIFFYAPFKPLGHADPSGDLVTATGIFDYLVQRGHQVIPVSSLRCRWIYWKPWLWPQLLWERKRVVRSFSASPADIWLTYHSYYKAPDLLGPAAAGQMKIPYVIFQGIYSTKRRRRWTTRPGFYLNKNTLCCADHVFTNKSVDLLNLKRLLPANRLTYVAPGIIPADFSFDAEARRELRIQWNIADKSVIFSAAMFRQDVKTEGLTWVIRACGELLRQGLDFLLVIAGDGKERSRLQQLAGEHVPGRVRFVGKIPRADMYRFYSAADLFVFPGIRESLGMVYLEAQSCGLPVVAFKNAGVPEAVQEGKTGLLVPMYDMKPFTEAVKRLLDDKALRRQMGMAAGRYVRDAHDLNLNYQAFERSLQSIVKRPLFLDDLWNGKIIS
jgi:glycosyltransferase involved in cell wall biosynthesis